MKREGPVQKFCETCSSPFAVKRCHSKARFCSMRCVGISQRGYSRRKSAPKSNSLICMECARPFSVPQSHAHRYRCCSATCRDKQHAKRMSGEGNANWRGGLSRLPYPYNFREISRAIIRRDNWTCQNPGCDGRDARLTAHHINYDKTDCDPQNLITLCSACNSKANFGRETWQAFYSAREHF